MTASDLSPEYSVPVEITALGANGREIVFAPDEAQRDKIAARLGVGAHSTFSGAALITRRDGGFTVTGRLQARLERTCVASLEPMTEVLDENFVGEFSTVAAVTDDDEGFDLDAPEPYDGAIFDAGEYFVQQISLAMAPYPRKSGAVSLAAAFGDDAETSPFQELAQVLEKKERN